MVTLSQILSCLVQKTPPIGSGGTLDHLAFFIDDFKRVVLHKLKPKSFCQIPPLKFLSKIPSRHVEAIIQVVLTNCKITRGISAILLPPLQFAQKLAVQHLGNLQNET